MKIIEAKNKRALNSVFAKAENADKAFERAVAGSVNRVRTGGDRALVAFAKKFDRLAAPIEVSRREMIAEAGKAPADVRKAIALAAKNIARVAAKQIPKHVDVTVMPGVSVEQRVEPLA